MSLALELRAKKLIERLRPHLPRAGTVLDIGAGTGHNANALRQQTGLDVLGLDVADLGVVGLPPVLFDGRNIPCADNVFSAGTMLFVMSYVSKPVALLSEVRRVVDGPLLVLQTTVEGARAAAILRVRGWVEGRMAFEVARLVGLIARDTPCTVHSPRLYSRRRLHELFRFSGWRVVAIEREHERPWSPSRDLWVLESST